MGSAPRSSTPTPTAWTTTVTTWRSAGRSRRLSDRRAPCEAGARAATGGGGEGEEREETGRGTGSPAYGRQGGLALGAVRGAARSGRPPRSRRGGDKRGWGSALPRWAVACSRPPFHGMDAAHKKRLYLSAHHHHTKPLGGAGGGVAEGRSGEVRRGVAAGTPPPAADSRGPDSPRRAGGGEANNPHPPAPPCRGPPESGVREKDGSWKGRE